jgi:hypothetical protein
MHGVNGKVGAWINPEIFEESFGTVPNENIGALLCPHPLALSTHSFRG